MATITKTYTENVNASYKSTWTIDYIGTDDYLVSASSFRVPIPTVKAKYVNANKAKAKVEIQTRLFIGSGYSGQYDIADFQKQGSGNTYTLWPSGTTRTTSKTWLDNISRSTASFFTSSNPTVRSLDIYAQTAIVDLRSCDSNGAKDNYYGSTTSTNLGKIGSIKLDAPPQVTATVTSTGPYYQSGTGLMSTNPYQVSVTASAQYGGTISKYFLRIGSTVYETNNGAFSISHPVAGTFTPEVFVRDSRGQETTVLLNEITINPTVLSINSLKVDRISSTSPFLLADDGTYARITATINYTEFTGNYLTQPEVKIGSTVTNNVTWYTSWSDSTGFSNAVNWTSYAPTSPVTLYGKCTNTFSETQSYTLSITPASTYATSTTYNITLPQSYYLLVAKAGGKGLGIGMKPLSDDLYVDMNGYFQKKIYTGGTEVTYGVKGNAESSYRTGQVNLTPANIGAVPTTRTVNTKALSSNITLGLSDISSTIGEQVTGSTTVSSFSSTTSLTEVASFHLDKGSWLIVASCRFASNSSGRRAMNITVDGSAIGVSLITQAPLSGALTDMQSVTTYKVTASAGATIGIQALQNSGSALEVNVYWRAICVT